MVTFLMITSILTICFELAAIWMIVNKNSKLAIVLYSAMVKQMTTNPKYVALYATSWVFSMVLSVLFGEYELTAIWMISLIVNLSAMEAAKKAMRKDEVLWGELLKR